MNTTARVVRNAARIIGFALGEGIVDYTTKEGIASVTTVIPTFIPDGISHPASLVSGYSWINVNKA